MSWPLIIALVLLGLVLIALEIVVLPGAVAGICGGVLTAVAIWQTYVTYGTVAGTVVLIVSLVLGIAMVAVLMQSRMWRKVSLHEEVDSRANTIDATKVKVGSRGVTITRVAPSGNARFDDEVVEVHTNSEFLDPQTPVEVVDVEGYKVVVKRVEAAAHPATPADPGRLPVDTDSHSVVTEPSHTENC